MGSVAEKTLLNAGAKTVWNFITNPKNFPKYVQGYSEGKVISHNKTGAGAIYEWYGKIGPFKLKSTEEVVEWKKNKRVAYKGKLFGIKFDSSMSVKKAKKNKTSMIVSIKYHVPVFLGGAVTDFILVRKIIKDYVHRSVKKLEDRF